MRICQNTILSLQTFEGFRPERCAFHRQIARTLRMTSFDNLWIWPMSISRRWTRQTSRPEGILSGSIEEITEMRGCVRMRFSCMTFPQFLKSLRRHLQVQVLHRRSQSCVLRRPKSCRRPTAPPTAPLQVELLKKVLNSLGHPERLTLRSFQQTMKEIVPTSGEWKGMEGSCFGVFLNPSRNCRGMPYSERLDGPFRSFVDCTIHRVGQNSLKH